MIRLCIYGGYTSYFQIPGGGYEPIHRPHCGAPATIRYRYEESDPDWWGYACDEHTPARHPTLTTETLHKDAA